MAIKLSGPFFFWAAYGYMLHKTTTIDIIDVITISQLWGVKLCGYRVVKDKNIKIPE